MRQREGWEGVRRERQGHSPPESQSAGADVRSRKVCFRPRKEEAGMSCARLGEGADGTAESDVGVLECELVFSFPAFRMLWHLELHSPGRGGPSGTERAKG